MTMDARKQRVLQAIVALYGLEGEPVGSSVLANYFDMAVSSATLRNEMAALTKLGLLEQPHTSAGRVPSAKGYRYYLDNLLTDDQPLDRVSRARVDAVFASLDHEPEKLAAGAAKALAAISGCTAAISTPCAEDLCIAHYEVVQVGRSAAAVLAVTTAGYVRTRVARVRTGLSRENAAALAALLNRNLTFVAPVDLSTRLLAELCSQIDPELVPVISAAAAILQDSVKPHVFLGGEQYLLDWPQLDGKVGDILTLLNDEEQAAGLIAPPAERSERDVYKRQGQYFGTFQRHAAGHDQADVAAAEDEHPLAYQIALHVDIALGGTGGIDAGGAGARDADGTAGALPAAHAEDDASGLQDLITLFPADTVDLFVRGDLQHHGAQLHPHAGGTQQFNAAACILRAGELLPKAVQTKAIVDALVQDAAQFVVPLQNQNIAQAVLPCTVSCGKACRAAADDDQINHGDFPPAWFRTVRRWYRLYPAARPAG